MDELDLGDADGTSGRICATCAYEACTKDCAKTHSSANWCAWQCGCIHIDGKDRMTCESQNPYIDFRETPPPPPKPLSEPPPPGELK